MVFAYPDNLTGIGGMVTYANSVTEYLFASLILLAIYIIILTTTIGKTEKQSTPFVIAGFITAIISLLFRTGGWINDTWIVGTVLILIISFVWSYFEGG